MRAEGGLRTKGHYKKSYPDKPLITVATVVFNANEELKKTLTNILNQKYDNIEYIIIDGGSSDGTLSLLKEYDQYIDYWISESDGGVYDAMNKAVDLASGVWINFMHAGDFFYKSDVIAKVFSGYNIDADLIYGDFYFLLSNGKLIPVKAKPLDMLWQKMAFSHQSLFTKTKVVRKYKFNLKYKVASDYNFILQSYYNNYTFNYTNTFISICSDGGISIKYQLKSALERWKIAKIYDNNNNLKIDRFHIQLIIKILRMKIKEKIWDIFRK